MKQNMIIFAFLVQSCILSAMDLEESVPAVRLHRTHAIIPGRPETNVRSDESLQERDARLTALAQLTKIKIEIDTVKTYLDATAHPFAGSPDLFAEKGISPKLARSPREVAVELTAQAAKNRAQAELDAKK